MNIAVLSCSRLPSKVEVSGGLGKSAYDVAFGLRKRGHKVTLYGATGSQFDCGSLVTVAHEADLIARAAVGKHDVWFDYSHSHKLVDLPVLNVIGDSETQHQPQNAVVASKYMQNRHPSAKIVHTGIDTENIPFTAANDGYLAFMARMNFQKGWDRALDVADDADKDIVFIGPFGHGFGLRNYRGALSGADKWSALGSALGLLAPYVYDASPRVPLEAAACGVPTLCLSGDGTQEHVKHGVSGFVCSDLADMASMVPELDGLDRAAVREWVCERHSIGSMITKYERLLMDVINGRRW